MSINKNKILEKRKRLEIQKEKNETRLRAIQLKLKMTSQKIAKAEKKDDFKRRIILGSYMLEKIKADPSFKSWLEGEIGSSNLTAHEKSLFGISETGLS